MWQVVYIVEGEETANEIAGALENEGFLVKMEQAGKRNYQVKTPAGEAEEVHEFIQENFPKH